MKILGPVFAGALSAALFSMLLHPAVVPATVYKWSQTAASNSNADGTINWAEGQAPSTINDSARAMMAAVAKYRDDTSGKLGTGGTSTAYTLTTNQGFSSLSAMNFAEIAFIPHATNGASATLNVDGLGAKALSYVSGTAMPASAMLAGAVYRAIYLNASNEWLVHSFGTGVAQGPASSMMMTATSCPSGWTLVTSFGADRAFVLADGVSIGVGSTAGSVGATTVYGYTGTSAVTLSQANLPSYTIAGANTLSVTGSVSGTSGSGNAVISGGASSGTFTNSAAAGAVTVLTTSSSTALTAQPTDSGHTHSFSASLASGLVSSVITSGGSGTSFTPSIDMRAKYLTVGLCSKN